MHCVHAWLNLQFFGEVRQTYRITINKDFDWVKSFSQTPAEVCDFPDLSLAHGTTADLVIFNARNWNELYSRPQSDRIVLRNGIAIDRKLPSYSELDALLEAYK